MKAALRFDLSQVGVDQASELLAEGDEGVNERVAPRRILVPRPSRSLDAFVT